MLELLLPPAQEFQNPKGRLKFPVGSQFEKEVLLSEISAFGPTSRHLATAIHLRCATLDSFVGTGLWLKTSSYFLTALAKPEVLLLTKIEPTFIN